MSIRVEARRVRDAFKRAPEVMQRRARGALKQNGQRFVETVRNRFGRSSDAPHSRSKLLQNSINFEVRGNRLADLELRVFSAGVRYANIQEYGGTIRAKNKLLTVPLRDAKTAGGDVKAIFKLGAAALAAREPGATFVVQSKTGKLLIGYRPGGGYSTFDRRAHRDVDAPRAKRQRTLWLWRLEEQVTIPARLGFRSTWAAQREERRNRIHRELAGALREVFGG